MIAALQEMLSCKDDTRALASDSLNSREVLCQFDAKQLCNVSRLTNDEMEEQYPCKGMFRSRHVV